jgi:hypothetical protein
VADINEDNFEIRAGAAESPIVVSWEIAKR